MRHLRWIAFLPTLLIALPASAQFRPGPGGAQPRQQQPSKPKGPAEAAPEDPNEKEQLQDPDVGWAGEVQKQLQFFKLNGYFRFRGDMFFKANLGQTDSTFAKAPFYSPISERSLDLNCASRVGAAGGDVGGSCPPATVGGANIRFRLEPQFNVSNVVRLKTQIDIFDNLMLGSTPNGFVGNLRNPQVPLIAFSDTQAPPIVGRNSNTPAIVVKRAWAEIDLPFGQVRVGRMPSHWGLGLLANNGQCWDCNFGDNQDRIMFITKLFQHYLVVGYDFAASGPFNLNVASGLPYYDGQVIDLEQLDDVDQFIFAIARRDKPEVLEKRVAAGELVLNYGMYFVYRDQDFDYANPGTLNAAESDLGSSFIKRDAWAVIPDIWFKLLYKRFYMEFEGVMIGGRVGNTSNENKVDPLDILQFGFVFKSSYKFLRKKNLEVGLEIGMASGDQNELIDLNRRRFLQLQQPEFNDTKLTEFRFDFDYLVDLILFREILGTVSNATYFKPWVRYDLTESFGARMDVIYSLAHTPVAYPGNNPNLGLELDFDLYYRNKSGRFMAGLQYGVLFPFAGLDRPASIYGESGAQGAGIAQTLQSRIIVKF